MYYSIAPMCVAMVTWVPCSCAGGLEGLKEQTYTNHIVEKFIRFHGDIFTVRRTDLKYYDTQFNKCLSSVRLHVIASCTKVSLQYEIRHTGPLMQQKIAYWCIEA